MPIGPIRVHVSALALAVNRDPRAEHQDPNAGFLVHLYRKVIDGVVIREHLFPFGGHFQDKDGNDLSRDFDDEEAAETYAQELLGRTRTQGETGRKAVGRELYEELLEMKPPLVRWVHPERIQTARRSYNAITVRNFRGDGTGYNKEYETISVISPCRSDLPHGWNVDIRHAIKRGDPRVCYVNREHLAEGFYLTKMNRVLKISPDFARILAKSGLIPPLS